MNKKMILTGVSATFELGQIIGQVAVANDLLILVGDLGTGKTILTKGIALGLGIEQLVKSPTYTIIREYRTGRIPLFHADVYRVASDFDEIGLEDYLDAQGLTVIEWGDLLQEDLPPNYLMLTLNRIDQENDEENEENETSEEKREITFSAIGKEGMEFLKRIEEHFDQKTSH